MDKPVFIYSLHRSGSTFLKNTIDASSEIKMLEDEVHFDHPLFRNTFQKLYYKYCNDKVQKYDEFLDVLRSQKIRGAFWEIYKQEFNNFLSSKQFLSGKLTVWNSFNSILFHILSKSEKNRIGIKYPAHFIYLEDIKKHYPDSKTIFLVRDPRAIFASKVKSPTNKRLNARVGIGYEIMRLILTFYIALEYRFFIKKLNKHENEHLVVKYENLVMQKKEQISVICNFCEIKINDAMFNATGKSSGYSNATDKNDRINRWKGVLRNYEKIILNKIAGKYISKMGYE